MNILIISFPLKKDSIGGEDQIACLLKYYWNNLGHNVDICSKDNFSLINKQYDLYFSLNIPISIKDKNDSIWINWVFNENLGQNASSIFSHNYDFYFFNSSFLVEKAKDFSISCDFLNFPSFPFYERTSKLIDNNNKKHDVLYLGNYHPEYKTLKRYCDYLFPCMNYNFAIYGGNNWLKKNQKELIKDKILNINDYTNNFEQYYKGLLPQEDCSSISDLSKIFINFNSPIQNDLGMINNRIFDLVSNGCFVITDDTSAQRDLFGNCVEYSNGQEDLKSKLDYYLNNLDYIKEYQYKALEFSKNYSKNYNYETLGNKILQTYHDNKKSIIDNRNFIQFQFCVIVNEPHLLDNCLKSIKSNVEDFKIKFIVNKNNRIKSSLIIKNHGFNEEDIIIIDEKNIYNYKLDSNYLEKDHVIIPLYSNVIYPNNFLSSIKRYIINNSHISYYFPFFDYSNSNTLIYGINNIGFDINNNINFKPYGCYIFKHFDCKNIDWDIISKKSTEIIKNISPTYVFLSENERRLFINSFNHFSFKKVDIQYKEKKIINKENLRISFLTECEININYENKEIVNVNGKNIEKIIRDLKSHYTFIGLLPENIDLNRIVNIINSRFNVDIFALSKGAFIKTGLLYLEKPGKSLKEYLTNISKNYKKYSILKIDEITYDIKYIKKPILIQKNDNGLKIALISMCGVSSYEDKYGIGGEHQVIHWLQDACNNNPDVYLSHIYDTYNYETMNADDYDIIFSNSCWRGVDHLRKRKDNLTVFWHFNMGAGKVSLDTVKQMNYDYIWTNSYIGHEWFKDHNLKCMFKQLNASSKYHYVYPYESELYKHDVCYVGGYQVYYKGKELIDQFIKPCCTNNFDFAIYGNRLWKYDVQKKASKTDSFFKEEYIDNTFEPFYKKILPMQDFCILAKNCKIWINFNAITQRNMQMNNDRVIWGLACGVFFITDDTPEARKFYNEDEKKCPVVFSSGNSDLLKKIDYYLKHEDERLEISSRGPEFIKQRKLYTEDTINDLISLYKRERYEY